MLKLKDDKVVYYERFGEFLCVYSSLKEEFKKVLRNYYAKKLNLQLNLKELHNYKLIYNEPRLG